MKHMANLETSNEGLFQQGQEADVEERPFSCGWEAAYYEAIKLIFIYKTELKKAEAKLIEIEIKKEKKRKRVKK